MASFALEQVFHQRRSALQALHVSAAVLPLASADQPSHGEASGLPPTVTTAPRPLPSAGETPRQIQRRLRYEQVCHLARQGWTFQAIAQQVGLHRKTVAQYVRADRFPVRARPRSVLDPYKPYLLACWNQGCRTGMRLYEAIQRQGYRGKRSTVLGYLGFVRDTCNLMPQSYPSRKVSLFR